MQKGLKKKINAHNVSPYINLRRQSTYYFTSIDELEENTVVVEDMKVCKTLLERLLSPYNDAKYKKIM